MSFFWHIFLYPKISLFKNATFAAPTKKRDHLINLIMLVEPIKTVEEYALDFKKDYDYIVNYQHSEQIVKPSHLGSSFEIFTMYTDKTPVTASNSSVLISNI